MKKYIPVILLLAIPTFLFSQTQYQHWQWAKSFGGSGNDKTADMKIKNGFLYVTGTFTSPQINWEGTILNNHGGQDIFVAKMDTLGNTVWVKSFGGGGDDDVQQLEINSNGTMVLRCTSASNVISIGSNTVSNPDNFFIALNINGNILNTIVLPEGAAYNDIDLDNESGVYICGKYQHSFIFNGTPIDSSYGLAGAVLLKYNAGEPAWYKNVQARANVRYELIDYSIYPWGPDSAAFRTYTPPITGTAGASMQIEYNEQDSILGIVGHTIRGAYLDGNLISDDAYNQFDHSLIYGFKISGNGIISPANFHNPWSTSFGNRSENITTGLSGYSFTTSGYTTIGGYYDFTITTEKNNRQLSQLSRGYNTNYYIPSTLPTAWAPFTTDESGNYLLCTEFNWSIEDGKKNTIILDTNLHEIKKTVVPEINRIGLSVRAMADTHAIFFGSSFFDGTLTVNEILIGNEIVLNNNGNSEIFIGKFICDGFSLPQLSYPYKTSYKTCQAIDSVQLYLSINDSTGAAPYTFHWQASSHFSDTNILNPKVYFGGDSIANRLTITDANGMRFYKDFVFFGGRPSDLRLVVSNTNICSNDSIVLSLEGTDFIRCGVAGVPWGYYSSPDEIMFTAIDKKLKYTTTYNHDIYLTEDYETEYLNTSAYCISNIPVHINVRQAFKQITDVHVCPGSDYTFTDNTTTHNIQNSFTHTIHFTNINGCDSNYVTNIIVSHPDTITITRHVCYDGSYMFPNQTHLTNITHDTLYACHYNTSFGCDSVVYYNFIALPPSGIMINTTICRGGRYVYHPYNYDVAIENILSDTSFTLHYYTGMCDSTVQYNLHVVSSYYSSQSVTVCSGGSLMMPDGQIVSGIISATAYTSRLRAVGGCDSTITTFISVNPPPHSTEIANVCSGGSYTFPDGYTMFNITSNISYATRYRPTGECYSIVHTEIRVNPTYHFSTTVNTCQGGSYTFPDGNIINNITNDTSYISRLTAAGGCDSIITTNIHVYQKYNFSETVNACPGSSYTFPDGSLLENINSNASHVSILHTVNGCDSTITTNINVVVIDTSVAKNNLVLSANAMPALYQWIDCIAGTPIATANNQQYTATSIGSYAVQINHSGCIGTSSCYTTSEADMLAGGRTLVNVYPVPARDRYTLAIENETPSTASIALLDFTGHSVMQQNVHLSFGKNIITQNISSLASGIYRIVISKGGNKPVIKTIIKL